MVGGGRCIHTWGKFSTLHDKHLTNKCQLRVSNWLSLTNRKQKYRWITLCYTQPDLVTFVRIKHLACWFLPNTSLMWTGSFHTGSGLTYPQVGASGKANKWEHFEILGFPGHCWSDHVWNRHLAAFWRLLGGHLSGIEASRKEMKPTKTLTKVF